MRLRTILVNALHANRMSQKPPTGKVRLQLETWSACVCRLDKPTWTRFCSNRQAGHDPGITSGSSANRKLARNRVGGDQWRSPRSRLLGLIWASSASTCCDGLPKLATISFWVGVLRSKVEAVEPRQQGICLQCRGPQRTRFSFDGVENRSSGVQFSPPPPEFVLVYGASPAFAARITCSGSKHQQNVIWHRTKKRNHAGGFPCRAAPSGAERKSRNPASGLD